MIRVIIIIIIVNFYNSALASMKQDIISKMQITNNLSFNFIQTIDNKNEKGMCIVEYPKKIYCEYDGPNKKIIRSEGKASTSFLQRKLQIGYNRAARIIDMMEADGIVSKANHVGKRDVL